MAEALLALVPLRFRPAAKAFYAFVVPLAAQVVVAVVNQGLSVGNAIRSVAVAALIAFCVHQVPAAPAERRRR